MPFGIWLFVLIVSGLTALFASRLTNSAATGVGAFLVLGIVGGTFFYLFGRDVMSRLRRLRQRGGDDA